jgi:hypothetical protein
MKYSTMSWKEKNASLTGDEQSKLKRPAAGALDASTNKGMAPLKPLFSDITDRTQPGSRPTQWFHASGIKLPVVEIGSNGTTDESNSPWDFN